MSGVFIIVTDWEYEKSSLLLPTAGGWPHITLFYSGNILKKTNLATLASDTLQNIMVNQAGTLVLEEAKVSTFFHERSGKQRYDVLLHFNSAGKDIVTKLRQEITKTIHLEPGENLSMGDPHVTHSIHWSEADAQSALAKVKDLLPKKVHLTGVNIN